MLGQHEARPRKPPQVGESVCHAGQRGTHPALPRQAAFTFFVDLELAAGVDCGGTTTCDRKWLIFRPRLDVKVGHDQLSLAPKFIHLKVHSAYSLLEGALPIGKIAKLADAYGMGGHRAQPTPTICSAFLEFSEKLSGAGIQPIAGMTLDIDFRDGTAPTPGLQRPGQNDAPVRPAGPVALYAAECGRLRHLIKLASRAFLATEPTDPTHVGIDKLEDLERRIDRADGRAAGARSAGRCGPTGKWTSRATALERAAAHYSATGSMSSCSVTASGPSRILSSSLVNSPMSWALPLVATNEVYFATPDDYEAHDALLCIAEGRVVAEDNRRRVTKEHYFNSAEDMAAVFADLPEAIDNTIEIAKRCAYRPLGRNPSCRASCKVSADTPIEEQLAAEAAELKRQAEAGLRERLSDAARRRTGLPKRTTGSASPSRSISSRR